MFSDTELDQTLSNAFLQKKASSNKGKRREERAGGGGGERVPYPRLGMMTPNYSISLISLRNDYKI